MQIHKIYLLLIAICILNNANAQFYVLGGSNYSHVRNDNLLKEQEDRILWQAGSGIRFTPFEKLQKLDVNVEMILHSKGYRLQFDSSYNITLNYLALPIYITYSPFNFFSVYGGTEFSLGITEYFSSHDDVFKRYDIGLIFGLNIFDNKRFSIYSRLTYGLIPMLKYYRIDEWGNFTEEINDLKNTTLTLGLKFNLYNEKIKIYNFFKNTDPVDRAAAARMQW